MSFDKICWVDSEYLTFLLCGNITYYFFALWQYYYNILTFLYIIHNLLSSLPFSNVGFYKESFQVLTVIENSLELETEFQLKGMLRPILIHIKTENEKVCKIYLKKLFFQNVLVLIDLFYRNNYPRYFTYSDCM